MHVMDLVWIYPSSQSTGEVGIICISEMGKRRFREVHSLPKTTELEMNDVGIRVPMHLNPESSLSASSLSYLPVKYTVKANMMRVEIRGNLQQN